MHHEYNEKNKEKHKAYYESHKDTIARRQKEYYNANTDRILEWHKSYEIANKEVTQAKRSEKVMCECGLYVTSSNISTHRKTAKHISLMVAKSSAEVNITTQDVEGQPGAENIQQLPQADDTGARSGSDNGLSA